MTPIETFVFLDIETTGLPAQELNKTKIIELSLIAVKRSHILETEAGHSPRVQNKLTLCFNPRRMVQPKSTKVTGLCNELLELETSFNEAAFNTINGFISLLSEPVCLIAHNGHRFDFPILKRHLSDLNVRFADDVLCADALYCFYDLDKERNGICSDIQDVEHTTSEEDSPINIKRENEVTPRKPSFDNTKNEENVVRKRKIDTNPMEISKVRRKIYFGDDPKPQKSYRLESIYNRCLKKWDILPHRAENDCNMLLKCSVVKRQQFVDWVDKCNCRFADVKSMTVGVPLGYD